jgi:hypothetical protein
MDDSQLMPPISPMVFTLMTPLLVSHAAAQVAIQREGRINQTLAVLVLGHDLQHNLGSKVSQQA